jgi:oxygen-dependent protoporphyrinogen oxidase
MGQLVERLVTVLGADPRSTLRTSVKVESLDELEAGEVVLAIPAFAAAVLLDTEVAVPLRELRYATVTHVTIAFDPQQLPDLPDATGFLVTRPEGLLMTACTFVGRKWDRPSESDAFVVRCSAGRIDDERASQMSDDELVSAIARELRGVLGITASPLEVRVTRYPRAMPQYRPGHLDRVAALTAELQRQRPGVQLAGAAYRGSSVPNCIRDGREAADQLLQKTPEGATQ